MPKPLLLVVCAINCMPQRLRANSPAANAAAIGSSFLHSIPTSLAQAIGRYQQQEVWGIDLTSPGAASTELHRALISSVFVRQAIAYEAWVDNRLVQQAAAIHSFNQ
jgi:hypothetical protein